jgi:2-dehydropantoate 2-reductase
VAFESVSVAGVRRGGGASWGEAMALGRGVKACFALIRAMGFEVYPGAKRRIDGSPAWVMAAVLWGMSRIRSFRELLAGGKAEAEALVGVMAGAAAGAAPGVAAAIEAMRPG